MDVMTRSISDVLIEHGPWSHGGYVADVAQEWANAGLSPVMVDKWLHAGVFRADIAQALLGQGITTTEAGVQSNPDEGDGNYIRSRGYKVCNRDLTLEQMVRLVMADRGAAGALRTPAQMELKRDGQG